MNNVENRLYSRNALFERNGSGSDANIFAVIGDQRKQLHHRPIPFGLLQQMFL